MLHVLHKKSFITMCYAINSSPLLVMKKLCMLIYTLSNCQTCPVPLRNYTLSMTTIKNIKFCFTNLKFVCLKKTTFEWFSKAIDMDLDTSTLCVVLTLLQCFACMLTIRYEKLIHLYSEQILLC